MAGGRRGAFLVVVLFATPGHVWAQSVVCSTIRSGETAARVAARITGAAENQHEPWFQILDPAAPGFIAKTRYLRIKAGWQACIVSEPAPRATLDVQPAGARPASTGVAHGVVLWIGLLLALAMIGWGLHDYVRIRTAALKRFGERFVREFDRPLVRGRPSELVVEARLRVRPHRARVEVLLAPRDGRPYPNLVDHRQNVEYDVERVLRVLEDQRFVHGPLYAQGRWVVVPLRLQVNPKQAGGT
jgi:hypothetical protein